MCLFFNLLDVSLVFMRRWLYMCHTPTIFHSNLYLYLSTSLSLALVFSALVLCMAFYLMGARPPSFGFYRVRSTTQKMFWLLLASWSIGPKRREKEIHVCKCMKEISTCTSPHPQEFLFLFFPSSFISQLWYHVTFGSPGGFSKAWPTF